MGEIIEHFLNPNFTVHGICEPVHLKEIVIFYRDEQFIIIQNAGQIRLRHFRIEFNEGALKPWT